MEKITVRQFLEFTNVYVPIYKVRKDAIVIGIGIENWEKYFGKEIEI